MPEPEPKVEPVVEPKVEPVVEPKKPETHTITVDGEEKILSEEEMTKYAQLGFSSTQRYKDASDKEKVAERGTRIESLVGSISGVDTPSESDVRELAGLLGLEPAEFMQMLNETDPPQKDKDKKTTDIDFDAEFSKKMGASPAEVRAILDFSQTRHVNDARKEIREISDLAVDKDEIIGKMVIGEDKKEIIVAVKDMVAEDVLRKIQDGKPFGADLVAASVQRVRSQLTKLGIPRKLSQYPAVLGLGPSVGLPSEIQADEPIKRVSSAEDGDEKNLVARTLQKVIKASRLIR